jgi:pre-mRNA-splicing factor SPF27
VNLSLLETYGKNAWLVGNSQLEDILRALEKEVDAMKAEQEAVESDRRAAQENAAAEMKGLEEGWRNGVGRMIETQAAAERLRMGILEMKRAAAA